MMSKLSAQNKILLSESIYKQLFGKILASDEGVDAEQLTQIALKSLNQLSLYNCTWNLNYQYQY